MLYFASLEQIVKQVYKFFNLCLEQALTNYVLPSVDMIMDFVYGGVARLTYLLMAMAMLVMDAVQPALSVLAGGRKVEYNGREDYLINVILYQSGVSRALWAIILLAMAISTYFSVLSITKAMRSDTAEKGVGAAFGKTLKTMLIFLLIPFITTATINLSMLVFDKTSEIISVANGSSAQVKLSNIIFAVSTVDAHKSTTPSAQSEVRGKYSTGARKYYDLAQVDRDFYFYKMRFILGILAALFFIYMYISVSIVFVYYLFHIVFLILISPFFVSAMILDEGHMFRTWTNLFVTRMIAGMGIIVSVRIFEVIIIPAFSGDTFRFFSVISSAPGVLDPGFFPDMFTKLFFIVMFGISVIKSHTIITAIVNANAAAEEKKVADFARRMTFETAKKAIKLAADLAILAGAVAAGIATAGAGSVGVGAAAGAAKGGAVAAKGAAAGAKAGAAVAKTGAKLGTKAGAAAAKTGVKLGTKAGGQAVKAGAKQVGNQIGSKVKSEIKNQAVGSIKSAASDAVDSAKSTVSGGDEGQS